MEILLSAHTLCNCLVSFKKTLHSPPTGCFFVQKNDQTSPCLTQKPEQRFTQGQLERNKELEADWWNLDLNSELTGDKIVAAKQRYYFKNGREIR